MKSYNHLWEKLIAPENIKLAIRNASRGKKKRKRVAEMYVNSDDYVLYFQTLAENFKRRRKKGKIIYDGISRKQREIIVPSFDEQVLHHMVVNVLQPIITKGMYFHAHGSIPKRGAVAGKKQIVKWIKNDPKNCKYFLKMDIKHFFGSIDHTVLEAYIARYIHDEKFLSLLHEIIECVEVGLPLGFHTSHWLAMWFLQGLDYHIKQELGAVHYIRYMDDMVIFGSNKKKLHNMRKSVERYLQERLNLRLKENWQVCRFHYVSSSKDKARFLDFMGFRFYRNRITLRKGIMMRMSRKARKIAKKPKPTIYDCKQILSALGWIKQTDTYDMYFTWIKPFVDFGKCKKRISNYDRKNKGGIIPCGDYQKIQTT